MVNSFSSIKFPIGVDKNLGRLAAEKEYSEHVKQLIKQVLLTNPGERVNRPDFGCGLRRMIFSLNNEIAAELVRVTVFQALETWLGKLIETRKVEVVADQEILRVRIDYILRVRNEYQYLNLEVPL